MPPSDRWLYFADEDLQMAQLGYGAGIWNQVCYHSQQAAEKMLKSMMTNRHPPQTHRLSELCRLVNITLPNELQESVVLLERFYIPTRYPDALPGSLESGLPNQADADEALKTANSLREFVSGL